MLVQKYFTITIFIAPAFCQYANYGLKPDVTFGEQNDRFDVMNILRHQKNLYKGNELDAQSEEYRRRGKSKHKSNKNEDRYGSLGNLDADTSKARSQSWLELLNTRKGRKSLRKKIVKKIEDQVNQVANTIITKMRSMRRFDENFAYHDNMNSGGGDVDDYNTNLKKFDAKLKDLKENKPLSARRLQDMVDELHGAKPTRRIMSDPEREILLHYAFPLDVKIEGFLQTPQQDIA